MLCTPNAMLMSDGVLVLTDHMSGKGVLACPGVSEADGQSKGMSEQAVQQQTGQDGPEAGSQADRPHRRRRVWDDIHTLQYSRWADSSPRTVRLEQRAQRAGISVTSVQLAACHGHKQQPERRTSSHSQAIAAAASVLNLQQACPTCSPAAEAVQHSSWYDFPWMMQQRLSNIHYVMTLLG